MSEYTLLDAPRNSEQAYGMRVSAALSYVEDAYREAALYSDRTLSNTTSERLAAALATLGELFPGISVPDAYMMTQDLIPHLNNLLRTIANSEDSSVRLHFQALLRARLYAGSPKQRVTDLVSDPELQAVATQDVLPLSIALSRAKGKSDTRHTNRS